MIEIIKINYSHDTIMYHEIDDLLNSEVLDVETNNDLIHMLDDIFHAFDVNSIELEMLFNNNKDVFDLFIDIIKQMYYNAIEYYKQAFIDDLLDDITYYHVFIDDVLFDFDDCICNYSDTKQMALLYNNKDKILKDFDLSDYIDYDIFNIQIKNI